MVSEGHMVSVSWYDCVPVSACESVGLSGYRLTRVFEDARTCTPIVQPRVTPLLVSLSLSLLGLDYIPNARRR
jgi:hypothetical protein